MDFDQWKPNLGRDKVFEDIDSGTKKELEI